MQNLTSTSKQFLFHDDLVTINRDILDFQDLFEESKSGPAAAFLPAQHLRHLIKFGMQPILEEILLVNKVGSNIALKCVKKTAKLLALNRNVVQV